MRRWSLILAFLLPLFATGHAAAAATWFEDKQSCIIAGAVGGAAVGALADSVTVGGGTVVGAILGALLCRPADADGDGVPDRRDKCPDTPQGVAVDPEGCPLDSDGDGVPDYLDKCPGTPQGARVDERGCEPPLPPPASSPQPAPLAPAAPASPVDGDADGDGVPDSKDRCPDTPPGTRVDHTGCPMAATIELKGVWFAFDSSAITAESAAVLDEVARVFKRYPDLVAEMAGHTCSIGSAAYNQRLSERRAQAVRDHLVSQGVPPAQLRARGYGEAEPLASNATRAGREQNRRTEMRVLEK